MSSIGNIAWKELRSYFTTWVAYAIIAGWLAMAGLIFALLLSSSGLSGQLQISPVYQNIVVVLLFVAPLLTMRLISEERASGSLELLFTSPLTEWQVALGKWLGAVGFTVVMFLLTLHIPYFALHYGTPDTGPIIGSYLALLFLSCAFCAVGLFCSSLTESQVVAGFLTFAALLGSWMLAWPLQVAPDSSVAGFFNDVSIFTHFQRLVQGALTTQDLVFFVSITFFFLFATVRVLESRKWK